MRVMARKVLYIFCIFAVFFGITFNPDNGFSMSLSNDISESSEALPTNSGKVLYISSYSPENEHSKKQIDGIKAVLGDSVILNIEYLESDISRGEENNRLFCDKLKLHYSEDGGVDVIIAGGDEALYSVLEMSRNEDDLFYGTPVIATGVYNEKLLSEAKNLNPYIIGKVSKLNYEENLDFILSIYPNAKDVVLISDNSQSGIGQAAQLAVCSSKYPELEFKSIVTNDITEKELVDKLSEYGESTILFYLDGYGLLDKNVTQDSMLSLVCDAASIPVFCTLNLRIGDGVIGGIVYDPSSEGESAANAALSVLNGASLRRISIDTSYTYSCVYDYNVITRFGIDISVFPSNCRYVGREESFQDKYGRKLAIGSVLVMFALVLIQLITKWFEFRVRSRKLEKSAGSMKEELDIIESYEVAKSEYLHSAITELKKPMSSLVEKTRNAVIYADDIEKTKRNIVDICTDAEMLFESFGEYMGISRYEKNVFELNLQVFGLKKIISELSKKFGSLCAKNNVSFLVDTNGVVSENLYGDCEKLIVILSNILSNAVKSASEGKSVDLTVTQLESSDSKTAILEFLVSDTGAGISAERLGELFGNSGFENNDEGIGFGLIIAKKYISIMDGKIEASSTEGEGTSVKITLPFEVANLSEKTRKKYKNPDEYDFNGKTVLVADDNELNLAITSELLKAVNLNTICVTNGREAVYKFNKTSNGEIDAVLLNSDMPIMTGAEAANTIRKCHHANSATVLIIAVIHDTYSDDVDKLKEAGVNDYIFKPIDVDELYEMLEKYLIDNENQLL